MEADKQEEEEQLINEKAVESQIDSEESKGSGMHKGSKSSSGNNSAFEHPQIEKNIRSHRTVGKSSTYIAYSS